ncbi:MAG: polyphosphate polymerase domain-containing protein [Vicinamibacterales bacterium]
MSDSRDVRTFASELKFVLEPAVAAQVRQWARTHLDPDPHGAGPAGDEYLTTSLYFDTEQFHVFQRRGSFGRSKYRIRRYGEADAAFLERKLREPTILAKRRTLVPLARLEQLDRAPAAGWSGGWFQARVSARRLRPVCQVSYRRTARLLATGSELVRLTLDDALVAQPTSVIRFREDHGVPVLAERQILELKFRHHIPAVFKRLVEEFALTPAPASKYRLSMAALGEARLAAPPALTVAPPVAAAGTTVHV